MSARSDPLTPGHRDRWPIALALRPALVALVLALFVVAAGTLSSGLESAAPVQSTEETRVLEVAVPPTGLGEAYDRIVARVVRANHGLERAQATLMLAMRAGAPASRLAALREAVAALERRYEQALAAIATAPGG